MAQYFRPAEVVVDAGQLWTTSTGRWHAEAPAPLIQCRITSRRSRLDSGFFGQGHDPERLAETFLFTFYPQVQNDRDGLVQVLLKGE